ncbi:hypothetical protein CHS0354_011347 [Potamilus streckersoni]|uniref:Uncharacterized protein n=1 Tax=Potamilus streckersoni TaxID=2493646 RepID=A0AAE0TFA1_9BIVA|nr:hypothetical protein CHS0354_011347 [Potamilus streckersoni]
MYWKVILVIIYLPFTDGVDSWDDWKSFYKDYQTETSRYSGLIPISDNSQTMNVTIDMTLYSLGDFDSVNGQIEIAGALSVKWTDEIPEIYSFTANVSVETSMLWPSDKLWTPDIVLLNAVDTIEKMGSSTYMVRISTQSSDQALAVSWKPRVVVRASCSPDVTYFPFDRQICSFTYTPWNYRASEVTLEFLSSPWDLTSYEENGGWTLIETKTESYTQNSKSYNKYTITIERRYLFYALNIILPTLLLSACTGCVFILPAEAGGRAGFSITCFLTFAVLLQTLMSFIPESSSPLSLMTVYLALMVMCGAFINILVILILRLYHKPEGKKVPRWLSFIIRLINFSVCKIYCKGRCKSMKKKPKQKIPDHIELTDVEDCMKEEAPKDEADIDGDDNHEVDWSYIGRILDMFFFVAFLGGQAALSVFFLLPLGLRAKD